MNFTTFPNGEKRLSLNSKLLSDDYLRTRILYLLRKSKFIELDDLVLLYISISTNSNEIYSSDFPKILKLDYFKRKDRTVINHTNVHLDMMSRYFFNYKFMNNSNFFHNFPLDFYRDCRLAIPYSYISIPYRAPIDWISMDGGFTRYYFMGGTGDQGKSRTYRSDEEKPLITIDYNSLYPSLFTNYLNADVDDFFVEEQTAWSESENTRMINERKMETTYGR